MDTSGRPREGLMTVIPVCVFLFLVVVALGGPEAFVNDVSLWISDFLTALVAWIKHI